MDLWAWVFERIEALQDSGDARLAELMERLPSAVVDQRHDVVEAMVPEALALARAKKDAWVELYVRHWLLQSRILHRHDVSHGLQEAVAALDFAHTEATAGCPQASCIVQDICAAWGIKDGPGHVDERVAVAEEGLAKIDPSWSCFGCITSEKASALEDGERYDECLAFCREQIARAEDRRDVIALHHTMARVLVKLGNVDEARAVVDDVAGLGRSRSQKADHAIVDAYVRAEAGDVVGAAQRLLPLGELDAGDVASFCIAALAIARRGGAIGNNAALGRTLRARALELEGRDARYEAAAVFLACAELAVLREQPAIAALCLDDVARVRPGLKRPGGLDRQAAKVAAALSTATSTSTPAALALDGDWRAALPSDPEQGLVVLRATHAAHPDDIDIALMLAAALSAAGFDDAAERNLLALRARFPDDKAVLGRLVTTYARQQKRDELSALVRAGGQGARLATLALADLDVDAGRANDAVARLSALVAVDAPAALDVDVAVRRATAHREAGDCAAALAALAVVDDSAADIDPSVFWERCLAATLLGDHAAARAAAARLGFQFGGTEGPIDEPFAHCKIRVVDDDGEREDLWAVRISPVSARLTQRRPPGKPCVYGDVVVFVPSPVAEADGPVDAGGTPTRIFTYPIAKTIQAGGARAFFVEGFFPGDAAVSALADAVVAAGGVFTVHSGDGYRLRVTEELAPAVDDEDGFGRAIVISVIVKGGVDVDVVGRVVDDHVRRFPRPMAYRGLLRALGESARADEQTTHAERWGFEDE